MARRRVYDWTRSFAPRSSIAAAYANPDIALRFAKFDANDKPEPRKAPRAVRNPFARRPA